MKSTEKLNPFVFEEDIAGQSNSFVQTFTVRDDGQNQGYAVARWRVCAFLNDFLEAIP